MKSDERLDDFTTQESICRVPREIWILKQIRHPHIVQMLDWADDGEANYFLVMPSHGLGMDLFEFIDRRPIMDESLGSYMFRQVGRFLFKNYPHGNLLVSRSHGLGIRYDITEFLIALVI